MPPVRITGTCFSIAIACVLTGPATAQPASDGSGRYSIAPAGDGFMRLDTSSGTVSHCRKENAAWVCAPAADAEAALRAEIADLARRVAALERQVEQRGPASAPPPRPPEVEMEQAFSFAERLMGRFFAMVEEMKRDEARP